MSRLRVIVALALTYALLGVMMNSVGVVILQSIRHFDATKPMGSTLEACKDLTVVAVSFLVATRVPLFGFRRALIAVLALMALACFAVSFAGGFFAMQALFVVIGLSFAIAKVATYATIGLLARDPNDHASITGIIEGVFMAGILAGVWLFGWFIALDDSGNGWLRVYWALGAAFAAMALLWTVTPIDERGAAAPEGSENAHWGEMARLAILPASLAVLAGLFFYVLIEQSVGTWLPTFNNEVLHLPAAMSVQLASIFVGASALGRLASGVVLRRVAWLPALLGCLVCVAALVLLSLPLAKGVQPNAAVDWFHAPIAAYLFPLLGVFLAPIYPTLCSVALSALPRHRHAAMMGLIVIFSALGGTIGSFITGMLFQHLPGTLAFYFTLVPMALIALILPIIRRRQGSGAAA
ncbi:MFS transporter [Sphingomonas immobilis]|uniref:MFS transporter n=1 Tax=Sphingomonas immobilis TaxID=3063997 RepID=A0ABT8ZXS9_9SPHN|nr:MFS transporter [Sphingomonas sp. CA1-15]MDO7841820.1 MFS transporter [Sphingomonas sp. CA1-15]